MLFECFILSYSKKRQGWLLQQFELAK